MIHAESPDFIFQYLSYHSPAPDLCTDLLCRDAGVFIRMDSQSDVDDVRICFYRGFIVLGFTAFVATKYGIRGSLWLLILIVLVYLYPVLLQRYNRPRYLRAILLSKHKESRSHNTLQERFTGNYL